MARKVSTPKAAEKVATTVTVFDHMTGKQVTMTEKQFSLLKNNTLNDLGKTIYRYTEGKAKVAVKQESSK